MVLWGLLSLYGSQPRSKIRPAAYFCSFIRIQTSCSITYWLRLHLYLLGQRPYDLCCQKYLLSQPLEKKVHQPPFYMSIQLSMARLHSVYLLYLHDHNPGDIEGARQIPSDWRKWKSKDWELNSNMLNSSIVTHSLCFINDCWINPEIN